MVEATGRLRATLPKPRYANVIRNRAVFIEDHIYSFDLVVMIPEIVVEAEEHFRSHGFFANSCRKTRIDGQVACRINYKDTSDPAGLYRALKELSEQWVKEQIERKRRSGG